jgi:hypothetical protein
MYLLSLIVGGEPMGLPGTTIDSVKFQRAAEGHPLDDVVVQAHDAFGTAATLEIQVKRDITFAPKDKVFKKVVGQIAAAAGSADFWNGRHELGIAVSRGSRRIDGPCKDVLTWARQLGDSKTFFERLNRPGSANDDMREFAKTFRDHLGEAGAANDDEVVWKLLRRLQIFVFDFTATGSVAEALMKERAVRALHPEDGPRAGELWKALTELAIDIASAGGDRKRDQLSAELAAKSYRLAGVRQNLPARQALAEASRNTLGDISDRVGGVMLTRYERVTAVRSALDSGRYVEIRGDAGVGKSGILKHFAEQAATESAIIALSPARTVPKGWTMLKAAIGFDGLAYDLLSELAGNGGAILFIDGLDFFGAEERLTAIDLVREAAEVPGMSVVVTARRDFGTDEPSWLPQEALDKLGRATPVVIDELSAKETAELGFAAPQLTALLSESHPARQVARNLYRLSRLASRPSGAPPLRTEAEMAEDWWLSADGAKDTGHRDRARVLRALAEQVLAGADHLTVAGMPAAAVEALIASESLRDLLNDRVAFRHDLLREWAVGNLLFSDPTFVERLPLDRPAPAGLARGLEIAARLAIERTPDHQRWLSLHVAVSKAGVSESWNRAVLLALVRSEIAADILEKASPALFADRAKMLRELIRIVMAVESEPAGKYYAALGIDPKKIPAGINFPTGPSWMRLILWLLKTGVRLPAAAIPEVVSLCWNWSLVLSGKDPLTPAIMRWFYYWLSELNAPPVETGGEKRPRLFYGELTSEQRSSMAEELRTGFLVFCNHTPELAADYVKKLREHPYPDRALSGLLQFRGSLAQAAPKELAELTADYLMPKKEDEEDREDRYRSQFRDAFEHKDYDFVPASPAQGPFFDLLLHAPEHALPLIRRIVDHAVVFNSGGKAFGKNAMTVVFPDGSEKVFAWHQTYGWPRDMGAGPSVVASALMALEAWGHGRIEKGDAVEAVIADIVGESPTSAAYLLVVVDLLLSNWPKSHVAAIPYTACPELLCLDRQRVVADKTEFPDILGVRELSREPAGIVSIESLKARASRRSSLDRLLDLYSFDTYDADRKVLTGLLRKAEARLGPPQKESDLGDPEFMVLHALNRVDPKNWREITVETPKGPQKVLEYVPPAAENDHLKPLQDEAAERSADAQMQASIRVALNDASRSSPEFAAAAVKWAQTVAGKPAEDETAQWMRDEAVVTAAMIAARDGGAALIAEHGAWIRESFAQAFARKSDGVHRVREGLPYNPPAIAFVGTALLLRNHFDPADARVLLKAAGDDNPAAAQGFSYVAAMLAESDERLPRAILRCGFSACVHPSRHWGTPEEDQKAQAEARRTKVDDAIEAEVAWIAGKGEEPSWPDFAPPRTHSRHHRSGAQERLLREQEEARPKLYTDHQAAALWLGKAAGIFDVGKRPWLRDLAKAYSSWTAIANGSDLGDDDDPSRIPDEWNRAYLKLLARCLPGLSIPEIDDFALRLVLEAPGEAFLDMTTIFVRCVDEVFFNGTDLGDSQAVHIRTTLVKRLMETRQWKWQCHDLTDSITMHLGQAIATLLFNDYGHLQPTKCYLFPKGIDRLDPFLPMLKELAENGRFIFVATTFLNLLEVSPRPSHMEVVCSAVKHWLTAHPDSTKFWIGHAIGRRVCSVIAAIVALDPRQFAPVQPVRADVDGFLDELIRMGVSEAHHLGETLPQV